MRLIRIIINYSALITVPIWLPFAFWWMVIMSLIEGDKSTLEVATGKEWYWK